jgi:hypothetical protein
MATVRLTSAEVYLPTGQVLTFGEAEISGYSRTPMMLMVRSGEGMDQKLVRYIGFPMVFREELAPLGG